MWLNLKVNESKLLNRGGSMYQSPFQSYEEKHSSVDRKMKSRSSQIVEQWLLCVGRVNIHSEWDGRQGILLSVVIVGWRWIPKLLETPNFKSRCSFLPTVITTTSWNELELRGRQLWHNVGQLREKVGYTYKVIFQELHRHFVIF